MFTGVGLGARFAVVLRPGSREAIEIVATTTSFRSCARARGRRRETHVADRPATRYPRRAPHTGRRDDRLRPSWGARSRQLGQHGGQIDEGAPARRGDRRLGKIDLAAVDVDRLTVAIGGSGTLGADGKADRSR